MLRYSHIYGWLLTVWLLLACSLSVDALTPSQSSASWGYAPAYSNSNNQAVTSEVPTCRFQSTSTYNTGLGNSAYAPTVSTPFASSPQRARMYNPWDEDGDPNADPIGVVPVGEPLVLLLMALMYVGYIRIRSKRA